MIPCCAKPLGGRTVILTRPQSQAGPLAASLRQAGARVVLAPLLRTAAPASWRGLDRSIRKLHGHQAVVFTSANAVRSFFARARKLGLFPLARPAALFAVGEPTARELKANGWSAAAVPDSHRAESLAKLMGRVRGTRVLFPRAKAGRDILPRALRRAGARVSVVEAYRTLPDAGGRRALRNAARLGADAVVFMSGSAGREFHEALPRDLRRRLLRRAVAASIGPVTSAALRSVGIRPAIEARTASAHALVEAIIRHFKREDRVHRHGKT